MTFTIETPFPNDLAPFKIVRTEGEYRKIVAAMQTREAAERWIKGYREGATWIAGVLPRLI